MYLFFDTETNGNRGLIRMTQLAFILTDESGNILEKYEALIKPDGWTIPQEKFFIENNMNTERCEKHGVPVFGALRVFQEALKKCKYKIAHNISFDNRVLMHEIQKAGITHQLFQFKKGFCTMRETRHIVQAKNKNGHNKAPNLQDLHLYCFGKKFDNDHDALADVEATVRCFFDLKNKGFIIID